MTLESTRKELAVNLRPSFDRDDSFATTLPVPVPSHTHSIGQTLAMIVREAWVPTPLKPPRVDPDLPDLPTIERVAEVFRYAGHRLEYTLSPGGQLRAWSKLNLALALFLGIPIILLMPVVTLGLSTLTSWSVYVLAVTTNLATAVSMILKTILLVTGGLLVLRFFFGGRLTPF
jgi:hypothetical protein